MRPQFKLLGKVLGLLAASLTVQALVFLWFIHQGAGKEPGAGEQSLIWVGAGAILFSAIIWFPFVRRANRAITEMIRATEAIAEGDFEVSAPADRSDELGQLAAAINHMASRLNGFVQGQNRFLGDIAHELCSPVARIQLALGILERKAKQELRANVDDLHEEVQEMSGLINELLSFSKAGLQGEEIKLDQVNLSQSVAEVVRREGKENAELKIEVDDAIVVMAEPKFLDRALGNLIRNAIRYAAKDGPIVIDAERDDAWVSIRVTDCGKGIPAESVQQIFDPFFRPDDSRVRLTGGAGLGLAIVRACIESCDGSVRCRNLQPRGFEVTLRLNAA
jgi:two-component system, OmpR family, sensor histidine kinase CpxA